MRKVVVLQTFYREASQPAKVHIVRKGQSRALKEVRL